MTVATPLLWFLCGVLGAAFHAALLWRGVQAALAERSAWALLLSAPLRLLLPALLLACASRFGLGALLAGLAGFACGGLAGRWYVAEPRRVDAQ